MSISLIRLIKEIKKKVIKDDINNDITGITLEYLLKIAHSKTKMLNINPATGINDISKEINAINV